MKQVVARHGRAEFLELPEPRLRRGEVLIGTAYSAVSVGTETWLIDGSGDPNFINHEYPPDPPRWPKTRSDIRREAPLPRPHEPGYIAIGYSLAGRVIAVEDTVVDLAPGDLVAASGSQCAHHAEVVAVPRTHVAKVPDGVDLADAALVTLGSIAVTALRATECRFGETVVLYGMGLLGLLGGAIGTAAGFRIIGLDIADSQLAMARRLGLEHLCNPSRDSALEMVRELTDGFGADGVIVGVKADSSEPLNHAFDMCRQRGTVVAQGLFGMEVDRGRFYANQISLVPAIGYGLGRYDPVYEEANEDYPIGLGRWTGNRNQGYFLELLRSRRIDLSPIAPMRIPFDEAPEAYERFRRPDRPATVVFDYGVS
jgi:threonine dehydrogenase-like Zn-dependent dehydrogenase